jgi:hypothetical protein
MVIEFEADVVALSEQADVESAVTLTTKRDQK